MKSIKQILISRDGMTENEADDLIAEAKETLNDYIMENDMDAAYDICYEFFGLEPDYLDELIEGKRMMKQFNKEKSKKIYTNGISYSQEELKEKQNTKSYNEWPILAPTGELIGFIKLESDSELLSEIWIRDRKYQKMEKISKI